MEELVKTPFKNEIRFICVDPAPGRPALPAWLKVVPTMIMADGSSPLIGPSAVNNWLFERKLTEGNSSSRGTASDRMEPIKVPSYSPDLAPRPGPAPKQSSLPAAISSATKATPAQGPPVLAGSAMEGPQAWHDAEMAGGNWSDSYSFLGGGDIVRNFELLPNGVAGGAGGGSSGPPAAKQTEKEKKLLADFEAFAAARDREFAAPKRIG